jgi:hypothetical protein
MGGQKRTAHSGLQITSRMSLRRHVGLAVQRCLYKDELGEKRSRIRKGGLPWPLKGSLSMGTSDTYQFVRGTP